MNTLIEKLRATKPDSCGAKCDPEIYKRGESIIVLAGPRASLIETFVTFIREKSGARIDWHYFGGRANILVLGHLYGAVDLIKNHLKDLNEVYRDGQNDSSVIGVCDLQTNWPVESWKEVLP